jgi:drug/metabolite transporter (DMT)-like permease
MMSSEISSIIFGLLSAASWGAGDFSGGFASKKTSVYLVVLISQFVGFLFLLAFAWITISPIPSAVVLFIGGLAGLSGTFGLLGLYHGLATGQMGVVAPVTAVIASILPVIVSIYSEGKPHNLQLLGFLFALIGVWFLSRGNDHSRVQIGSLKISVSAGVGFGLFFILIDRVSSESILWPLIAARIASVFLFWIIAKVRYLKLVPPKNRLFIIALSGFFDAGGNVFYAMATRVGRLDIAAVLSSLYPAVTVLLAWLILKERLGRQQWLGVCSVVIALILISS